MKRSLKTVIILLSVFFGLSSANSATVFGPETYTRSSGPPNIFSETFDAISGRGTLRVQNGEIDNKGNIKNAVSSACIFLNDEEIFGPSDFKKKVHDLESPIDLNETNTLRVELHGKPGTFLTIEILQEIPSPVIVSFTAEPETILTGHSSELEWRTENATTCTIDMGIGEVDPNGSILVSPSTTLQYTLTATGPGGTAEASVTVTVMDVVPSATIEAFPPEISQGESFELSWDSSNAQYAYIDNNIGEVALSGSMVLSPEQTTLYILTVTGQGGSASAQVQVRVLGNPEPQPEGSFGWNYQDLIPADATVQEYAPDRFSVITGSVQGISGTPSMGVSVGIHNHPEYGTASTGPNGEYSIPVEGGGVLTLAFQKDGYLCAHRKIAVPWNEITIVEPLKMISHDQVATTVHFDGNPNTIITHQSTEVADEFGSRSCTLVFQGDNRAYALDEDGNEMFELESITARATEFTNQDAMPARLPPNSGYTYCAELSADGIKNVLFEKPVVVWVGNFLGFGVGEVVPVGYYDRSSAVWVPSDNGVVVKLLDEDGDGVVDALDANGDDLPDDLNSNGSYTDEVTGLTDPAKYVPGNTFFRVAVYHFTPFDLNWPYGPPEEATPPNPEGEPDTDQKTDDQKACKIPVASSVEERSRILHEDVAIPGTDMTLHYSSNRAPGYMTVITVPASGESVPDSLTGIRVEIDVAGNKMAQELAPQPNQTGVFVWDRLDYLGRPVNRKTTAKVGIGFLYNAVYYRAGDFDQAFAKFGCTNYGCQMTTVRSRQEVCIWKRYEMDIMAKERADFLEGWSLSKHHFMDCHDHYTLHKGDGSVSQNSVHIIETSAGTGTSGYSGDGGPATEAELNEPFGLALDASGNIYIADRYNNRIRKVDGDGVITTVAGNGDWGYNGDGGLAIDAILNFPNDVAAGPDGDFYFADTLNHCIRKVNREGIITTVAGNGTAGYSGDGGLSIEAQLFEPYGVTVDALGNILIAELGNHCIRMVESSGIIITVAGNGTPGFSGDGGPANEAQLQYPSGVAVDTNGNIYIADCSNHRVRKVDTSGIITTVAGTGIGGYNGDGIAAVEARLSYPYGVSVDNTGALYISDTYNHRIRKVDMKGVITTVAGQGTPGYDGDGGSVGSALLNYPIRTTFDGSGRLFIADTTNKRIREVGPIVAFSGGLTSGEMAFVEEDGDAHIMTSGGLHKETIDLHTGITLREFAYDQDNHLISTIDRFGNQMTIQRDATGIPTSITSPDGLVTTLTTDGNGYLARIGYPDGSDYDFEYSPDGLVTAKKEPQGNRFEHFFDQRGRLIETMDEEGGHWLFNRAANPNGDILSETTTGEGNLISYLDHTDSTGAYASTITDPTGALTFFLQSADGLTVNKSFSCGMDLEFKYDLDPVYKFKYVKEMTEITPSSLEKITSRQKTYYDTDSDEVPDLIVETVAVNGKTTLLQHIVSESKKFLLSPQGRGIIMNYDPQTLLTTTVSIPGLFDTSYGYDARGRPTSITTHTRQSSFTYNAQGFLGSVTDPKGYTTSYIYDSVGRVNGIHRPDGSILGFTYDPNGNMTVLINPADVSHHFGYNKVNLNSTYQTPVSGSYTYVYDKDRRLIRTSFPSGYQIHNVYDTTRLAQIQTPEGNIDFTYLCGTKIGSISKGSETITYGYDGRLITLETLAGTLNQNLSYGYNNDFDLDGFTYAGDTVHYTYDNDGLLTGAGVFTISRNSGNGLPEEVTGGALDLTCSFNGYGEVEQAFCRVGAQGLSSWDLTRDDTGRITHKTETIEGVPSNYDYIYDPVGRLLTVTKDGVLVEEYQYGPNGARIYETNTLRGITGRDLSYSDGDHLLSAGDVTYLYDVDGYLYTKTQDSDVTTYTYSSRGELLNVTLPDGTLIEYLHDPLGRRIAKKVNGAITEKYLWQGLTRLLAVYDGSDNLVMRFQYADARMPYAMTRGGSTFYLTYDPVGSLRVVADAAGNVVKRIDYDSFGNVIADTDPAFEVPFGFAGGLHDRDTRLVRFGYRDYDPDIGRWTAKDPIFFAGGDTDLYGYCLNDPVNATDPEGLQHGRIPTLPEMTPGEPGMPGGGGYNPSVPDPNIGLDPSNEALENFSNLIKRLNNIMYHPKTGTDFFKKLRPKPKKDHPCK